MNSIVLYAHIVIIYTSNDSYLAIYILQNMLLHSQNFTDSQSCYAHLLTTKV
jgi:hypothetical protein